MPTFVDSHCHLNFSSLAEKLPTVLENMRAHHVKYALCVSVDLENFPDVLMLAKTHNNLFASVGVHPDYENIEEPTVIKLCQLSNHPKVVAIGETGLDYFRLGERTIEDMEWQRKRFRVHIQAAIATKKPLIIHTRAASEDTLRLMKEEQAMQIGGVMHCFTESWEVAKAAIDMGFYISISGIVTFKSAKEIQEVARKVPIDRLLIETDSPFLAPVPYRGETNEPAFVSHVARFVANLRGITEEELADATTHNFFTLFRSAQELPN